MIIEKILKKFDPETIKKEKKKIKEVVLPLEIQKWVKEYKRMGDRDPLVWLLIFRFIEIVDFSPIPKKYRPSLLRARFLSAMLVVLVDDIVDRPKNKKLKERLLNIPSKEGKISKKGLSAKECSYLNFTLSVWREFFKIIKAYPQYKIFKEVLYFDILQIFNSMRFSALINNNLYLINTEEYWGYSPNSMQLMLHNTLNLMCLDNVNKKELGKRRKIMWHAQYMLRIGNCLSTWEREIKEKDYSNGIFAHLLEKKILSNRDLGRKSILISKKDIIKIESHFFKEWERHYNYIKKLSLEIKFFNVGIFLSQLENILILHLSVRNI